MNYWTHLHEDKIIEFQKATTIAERNKIYSEFLHPVLVKMCEIILMRYFFAKNSYQLGDHKEEMETIAIVAALKGIDKFKPEKGKKAFSYLQTIIKNEYHDFCRKFNKENEINKNTSDVSNLDETRFTVENEYITEINNEPEIDPVDAFLFKLKKSTTTSIYSDAIIECVEKYRCLNKLLISYYLLKNVSSNPYTIKSNLHKLGLLKIFTFRQDLQEHFNRIFQKYNVTPEQTEDWQYLCQTFKKYNEKKTDERNRKVKKFKSSN